jgi:trans-aconitate methyltransferase
MRNEGSHQVRRSTADASRFDVARRETIRYHEELYSTASLGQAGTWLARPHRLLRESLALVRAEQPVVAYDLGAGVGRHTLPLLGQLPAGSEVFAVDLLPSALEKIEAAAPACSGRHLHVRPADLDEYEFETPADLVFAFSVLEHLPTPEVVGRVMARIRSALNPGGVVAIGIVADRVEIEATGRRRPAHVESALTSADAARLMRESFHDCKLATHDMTPAAVQEEREGSRYTLASTLVTWLASAPGGRTIDRDGF